MAHLLIADDMNISRDTLARVLREAGHRVTAASSGAEAVERVRQEAPDMVILDYNMPGMNGAQTAAVLKGLSTAPLLPVMIVTGRSLGGNELSELLRTVEDIVRKPYTPAEVCARVEVWLRVRRLVEDQRRAPSVSAGGHAAPAPGLTSVRNTGSRPVLPGSPGLLDRDAPPEGGRVRGRAEFLSYLGDIWDRSLRKNEPFAVLLCELGQDGASGVVVEGEPLRVLGKELRQGDVLGLLEGPRAGIILPGVTLSGGLSAAERLRGELRELQRRRPELLPGGAVLGMALCPARDLSNAEELLHAVEQALLQAREDGPFGLCVRQHHGALVRVTG